MTRQEYFEYCLNTYGTIPDYPFEEDFESAVMRHTDNKKWFSLLMRVPKSKLGFKDETVVEVLNLKIPPELFGSFGAEDHVFPAYHMNKLHWVSVMIEFADDEVIKFLVNASYTVTSTKKKNRRRA